MILDLKVSISALASVPQQLAVLVLTHHVTCHGDRLRDLHCHQQACHHTLIGRSWASDAPSIHQGHQRSLLYHHCAAPTWGVAFRNWWCLHLIQVTLGRPFSDTDALIRSPCRSGGMLQESATLKVAHGTVLCDRASHGRDQDRMTRSGPGTTMRCTSDSSVT